jgi:hypothetical protein
MNFGLVLTISGIIILIMIGTGFGSTRAQMEVSNKAKSSTCFHGLVSTGGNINCFSYGLDINDFTPRFITKAGKYSINITKSSGPVLSATTIGSKLPANGHLVHQIGCGFNRLPEGTYHTMFIVTDKSKIAMDSTPFIEKNLLETILEVNTCGPKGDQVLNGFDRSQPVYIVHPLQASSVQTFNVQNDQHRELTVDNVRQSRLLLLEGINNAILRLMTQEQKTLMHTPGGAFDTTHIAQLLKTDQLNSAIVGLQKLKAQVIKTFCPKAAGREVIPQIDNLIASLKLQEIPSQISPTNFR